MKAFFLSRLLREKLLLLGLIVVALLIWLSSFSRRAGKWQTDFSATSNVLKIQDQWLKEQAAIEARAATSVGLLDASRTLNANKLQAELEQIARTAGLPQPSTDEAKTSRSSQFAEHSLKLEIRNADYASLVTFYKAIVARSPYIGIKSFQLSANRANANQLNISMNISSVEISR